MGRAKTDKDLTLSEFDAALELQGFRFDGRFARYQDMRSPPGSRAVFVPPVRKPNNQIDRLATIEMLLLTRAARAEKIIAAQRAKAEQTRIAEAIAPQCLPPPRAALQGAAAIAALADDFLTLSTRADGVRLVDLIRLGWDFKQIKPLLAPARELAYARQGGNAA